VRVLEVAIVAVLLLIVIALFGKDVWAWEGIVVHHSDQPNDFNLFQALRSMDNWHVGHLGWKCIGYHYVIGRSGMVENTRPLTMYGAHAKNPAPSRNGTCIGVALVGKDKFPKEQIEALKKLCRDLCKLYDIKSIQRHHEQCPGKGIDIEKLEEEILNEAVSKM